MPCTRYDVYLPSIRSRQSQHHQGSVGRRSLCGSRDCSSRLACYLNTYNTLWLPFHVDLHKDVLSTRGLLSAEAVQEEQCRREGAKGSTEEAAYVLTLFLSSIFREMRGRAAILNMNRNSKWRRFSWNAIRRRRIPPPWHRHSGVAEHRWIGVDRSGASRN